MRNERRTSVSRGTPPGLLICLALALFWTCPTAAQPPALIQYTEALERPVHRTVELPGTVEALTDSVVASEAEGLVVTLEVQEGQRVELGQPLVRLRTVFHEQRLEAAEGRLREAQARLKLADSKLARARELFDDQVISQDQLDDAFSESTAWTARVDQSRAEIASLKETLDRSVIRAPFGGVVVHKSTDVGEWVRVGGAVVEMVALEELDVMVEVPESYYAEIVHGSKVSVTFDALGGGEVAGRVAGIIPRADAKARTFPVRVRIHNPRRRIGVGMLARVALPVGESHVAVLVPKDAVVRQGESEIVFRFESDSTVQAVPIRTGQGLGAWVAVEGDIEAGQRVVTRGNERLRPGQPAHGEPQHYEIP